MTSKWIEETKGDVDENDRDWITLKTILDRIDKLLRNAAFSTDDENLHDEILKEIKEEN